MKIYSQPTCKNCIMVKSALKRKGIEYEEINIKKDKDALEYIKSIGKTSLPVIELDDGTFYTGEASKEYVDSL